MRTSMSATFFRSVLLALGLLTASVASAQRAADENVQLIKASPFERYARYYAPYAIQAAAAYLEIRDLDDRRYKQDSDGYGADVNFAVQNVFGEKSVHGQTALKGWQYQFGSDKPLDCIVWTDECKASLKTRGWDFGSGPAFQVWARKRSPQIDHTACTEVSIAFRGTVGFNRWDWLSNVDRVYSPYDDYYKQLRRNIDGILGQIQDMDCYRIAGRKPQIVSTGHSLGGGLAQFVALSHKTSGPKIVKVFAFDPSPVTGAHIIDKTTRLANARELAIDRIYQEGEVLAWPRWAVQEYPSASSTCRPFVRTVKVDAVPGSGLLNLHGIKPLAVKMVELSYDGDRLKTYQVPQSPADCPLRYGRPDDNGDTFVPVADGQQPTRYASRHGRGLMVAPTGALGLFGVQADVPATKPLLVRTHRVLTVTRGHKGRKVRIANS